MIELLPMMPTTWSVVTSCLASEAICDGLVCSVTGKNLTGCPLIPPLALTHAKYAPAMFSMSLKSVPGCLVLIAPMLIGVPVAATPGLVPHEDVETVPALAAGVDAGAAAAAAAARVRQDADLYMCSAFSWLTTCHLLPNGCALRLSAAALRLGASR